MKRVFSLMRAYFEQVFLAIDQLVNALIPPLDGTISYADETLSARSYRAWRDGKILGMLTMKPINLLFFWQGPDHCKNAYTKEFDGVPGECTTHDNTAKVVADASMSTSLRTR